MAEQADFEQSESKSLHQPDTELTDQSNEILLHQSSEELLDESKNELPGLSNASAPDQSNNKVLMEQSEAEKVEPVTGGSSLAGDSGESQRYPSPPGYIEMNGGEMNGQQGSGSPHRPGTASSQDGNISTTQIDGDASGQVSVSHVQPHKFSPSPTPPAGNPPAAYNNPAYNQGMGQQQQAQAGYGGYGYGAAPAAGYGQQAGPYGQMAQDGGGSGGYGQPGPSTSGGYGQPGPSSSNGGWQPGVSTTVDMGPGPDPTGKLGGSSVGEDPEDPEAEPEWGAADMFMVVQPYERAVVFRLGKLKTWRVQRGLVFQLPCTDSVTVVDVRTRTVNIPPQEILTKDSVTCQVDGILFYEITRPVYSVTKVEDLQQSVALLASTALRAVLGHRTLPEILSAKNSITKDILGMVEKRAHTWGVHILRVDLKDMVLAPQLQRALVAEAEASRSAKAQVIKADGEHKAAEILTKASEILNDSAVGVQLRYLQTLNQISAANNKTVVLPLPPTLAQKAIFSNL